MKNDGSFYLRNYFTLSVLENFIRSNSNHVLLAKSSPFPLQHVT